MSVVSVGTDLIECERIARLLDRHHDSFMQRVLTAGEQAYVAGKAKPIPHIAGRFAAKEAILKALGTGWRGQIAWTDIDIVNDANGQPHVTLSGHTAALARQRGIAKFLLSITHTEHHAAATAIGLSASV